MSLRVLSWVLERSPVNHRGDLLVLLVLADHAHDDGDGAYPSVATIARKARLSERGARIALRKLEAAGAITATGRGPRGTVTYRVLMPDPPAVAAPRQPLPPEVASGEGRQSVPPALSLSAPEPSIEPSSEPSNPPNPPRAGGDWSSMPDRPRTNGGRQRDRERWRTWLLAYCGRRGWPQDHRYANAVDQAIRTGNAEDDADVDYVLAKYFPDLDLARAAA